MSYNRQQQGFNHNPGGVPQSGSPAHPNVNIGQMMQPYVALITAKLYNDMAQRETPYTQYMARLYSENGYNNDLIAEAVTVASDYAEYLMVTTNRDFNSIIDGVISDSNTAILEYHYRNNPNKIPVALTQNDIIRQNAILSKMSALKPKINEYKAKFKQQGNNVNQYQTGSFPMPQSQGMYPQQQMNPAQQQMYQQQLNEQQLYQQMLQQQQQVQNPQMQQQMGGYPSRQAPAYAGGSAFAQSVENNMRANQMQQQPQYQPQYRQQQPQQFNNMGFQQNPMFSNMMPNNQHQMMQQFNNGRSNHIGSFATNTNQMQQMHNQQQRPVTNKFSGNTGYDPMPAIDQAQLDRSLNSRPVSSQPTQSNFNPHILGSNSHQQDNQQQPMASTASTTNSTGMSDYEKRVRTFAIQHDLPHDISLSLLESSIVKLYPDNGIVDPRNAYTEINKNAQAPAPTGFYSNDNPIDSDLVQVNTYETPTQSKNFADTIRDQMAAKSDKTFVKQADGSYVAVSKDVAAAFKTEFPNVPLDQGDLKSFKKNLEAPYPFATMNLEGEWIVHISKFKEIRDKGSFVHTPIYPVNTRVGYYVVNDEGVIIDFFSRPKEEKDKDMDFNLHDDTKFFVPLTKGDVNKNTDDAKMLKAFANLQIEQKVEQVIKEIEEQSDVLSADDKALVVDRTVLFEEQHNGEIMGDDYAYIADKLLREELDAFEYTGKNLAMRYVHVHMYPWLVKDEDLQLVKRLRHKTSYTDIAETLTQIAENDAFQDSWYVRLNDAAVRYVNRIIELRYPLDSNQKFKIRSFCIDIESAIEEMYSFGYGEDFESTARQLAQTLLYPWLNTNQVHENYFGELSNDNDSGEDVSAASFGIVRDITVVPLHSRDIPLYSTKEQCILTEHGFPALWEIAQDRMINKNANVAEVVIVTSDNRAMYITETSTKDIYVITSKSIFE